MNRDQVQGRMKKVKGKVKEVAGKAIGSKRLEARGKGEQVGGRVQAGYGSAKKSLGKLKEGFRSKT
jgi:uncharacterized protein YjbJ (UPF0337 family)